MEPTVTEWAYLAGLIDGEGSLAITQKRKQARIDGVRVMTRDYHDNSYQCQITISNTDRKMIDWIVYTFSASIYFARNREGNRKPQYTVSWQDVAGVQWIISNTLPYLITKLDVAEAMLMLTMTPRYEKEMRQIVYKNFKDLKTEFRNTGKEVTLNNER